MNILNRFLSIFMVAIAGMLVACGETTIEMTGTGTQTNPVTGAPFQTEQKVSGKAKSTGLFAPSANAMMNTMTGANASGVDYGYGYGGYGLYPPPLVDVLPRGTVLVQGPGPGCAVVARRLSGQENCVR